MTLSNAAGVALYSMRCALPQACALCAAPAGDALVCAGCARDLPRLPCACPVCALPSASGSACGACLNRAPPFAATVAPFAYAFPLDRLVQALKYRGQLALAAWLADALADAVAARGTARPDVLVAMPLAPSRQRDRGFNQAAEIARRVAHRIGMPLRTGLVRTGEGPPQAALPWAQRIANLRNAFACDVSFAGRSVALVDDVMTTGATLRAAALALRRGGAARVEAWVVARTLPPQSERVMFAVVLVHPEIPPNTGNVIRLTANTATELHLVEPLGFRMDDRELKRAGLDYHEYAQVRVHRDFATCRAALDAESPRRWCAFTTTGTRSLYEFAFAPGDVLVFGAEAAGLPAPVLAAFAPAMRLRIPMRAGMRSLNLSNAVAVAVYEAWRQQRFAGGT